MSTSVSQGVSLEQHMEELKKHLQEGKPNLEAFQKAYQDLRRLQREFQDLLQWAAEEQRGREDEKKFTALYRQVAGWNASDLIDSLNKIGFKIKKNALKEQEKQSEEDKKDRIVKDTLDRQGYRILELVRAGKRDEAFHAILRIFVSAKKEFPPQLVEAFKPVYPDEFFKVFLFSFLSGILGKETQE